ncbi:hypothetical protein JTB14_018018, partial [Gonioctena quinquepunctata]
LLKQVKIEEAEHDKIRSARKKREVSQGNEKSYYDENDESEYNLIEGEQNIDSQDANEYEDGGNIMENFASNDEKSCSCDKTSGDCKCDNRPSKTEDIASKEHQTYAGKSSAKHCSCNKNNNDCKCVNELIDALPKYDMIPKYKVKRMDVGAFHEELTNTDGVLVEDYRTKRSVLKRATKPRRLGMKKPFENGEYFVDLLPNIFKISSTVSEEFKGIPVKRHLVPVKQQRMSPSHSRFRRRVQKEENNREPRQLIDMSDEDLFGALPQSFEGELARYKRVKRDRKK